MASEVARRALEATARGVFADRMFVHCALGINSGNPSAEIAGGFVKRKDTQGADV